MTERRGAGGLRTAGGTDGPPRPESIVQGALQPARVLDPR